MPDLTQLRICNYTTDEQLRLRKADFAYFAVVAYPDCPYMKLRTITDWFNWVCPPDI